MATNYAPLIADLFLFCFERDFMLSDTEVPFLAVVRPNLVYLLDFFCSGIHLY